jgi:hypothetical protein
MADSLSFVQVAGTALYEIQPAGPAGWAGYVLPAKTLPAEIPIADSISAGGSFVFASGRPAQVGSDPAGLARDALAYVAGSGSINPVVFWLKGVSPVVFGELARFGFEFSPDVTGKYLLRSNMNARLGSNLEFVALQGLTMDVQEEAGTLRLFKQMGSQDFLGFRTGGSPFGVQVVDDTGNWQIARIPFAGESCGCITFQGQITPAQAFAPGVFPPAIAYAVRASGADTVLGYPVLAPSGLPAAIAFAGAVDPGDPGNASLADALLQAGYLRTGMALAGAPELPSAFRTSGGNPVSLVPLGTEVDARVPPLGAGAITVASASPAGTDPSAAAAYFSLAGRFGLAVPKQDAGSAQDLLCGLFGSERVSFASFDAAAAQNDLLAFLPGQPGYAPVYPFETATMQDPGSGGVQKRLTAGYATAWATMLAGAATPQYRAEPEGSALYAPPPPSPQAAADEPVILLSAPPGLPVPQGMGHTFPLVPYAGAGALDAGLATGFESQILAPTRKGIVSAGAVEAWRARAAVRTRLLAGAAGGDAAHYRTTPQGLVARVDPGTGAYLDVQLAQSTDADGKLAPFSFGTPTHEMQDALQTNQLFVAAVNPAPFTGGGATFQDSVYVGTGKDPASGRNDVWKLSARVGDGVTATSYRNVMIMKFCSGSLRERVTNPNRWTAPGVFSLAAGTDEGTAPVAYTGLSQWLQDYIEAAILRAAGPSGAFYQNFRDIATDPDWNGVIVLRADLSADDLPEQIRGLAAGINFSEFTAHHFGFTVSRVHVDPATGVISMLGDSSIFGLIDYENPAYAQNLAAGVGPDVPIPAQTADGFGFTVLQLQSLFENTRLVDFKSHVQLSAGRLFGSAVTGVFSGGERMPASGVVLDGSYVDQNGTASYVFQQTTPSVFTLDSNVLPAVAFNRVQFNTLGTRDGGATELSRFLVWGAFDFAPMQAADGSVLDVFSFGSAEGTPAAQLGRGLAFSNLVIGMSFPRATPQSTTFALGTANLAYDLNASSARDDSLFKGFGLQLKSFVNAEGGQKPAALGFLPVTSALKLQPLDDSPWFGVVFEVTMGGPGALAASAGFTSNLLLAWSPATRAADAQRAVFVGLSLPGAAPGAKLFSVQGVLKVGIGSIALLRQPVPGPGGRFFYCLRLDDIGLKLFGMVKLPPSANIQFFLFGDPDNTGSLGWYAAYVADDNPGCGKKPAFEPLHAGRALPPAELPTPSASEASA